MNSFPKTAYCRPLVPKCESVDEITNPYFKSPWNPYAAENEAEFVLARYFFNKIQYPCVHTNLKNMKKFVSEIFKHTRSGKPDVEEASHNKGHVIPKIQEK